MNIISGINFRGLIATEHGQPMTTSYAVAEAFNKRHSDVLRAIKNMRCSDSFRERNFSFTLENKQIGNTRRDSGFYRITERGFMFLVMGFTGAKADAIKEAFIDAFEWMTRQLTETSQSLLKRHNLLMLKRQTEQQCASLAGRDLRQWRDTKKALDTELAVLESNLIQHLDLTAPSE